MGVRRSEPRVFFAWEQRRGIRALVAPGPARRVLVGVAVVLAFVLLWRRDKHVRLVNETRAEITTATRAVTAWRADHDRGCPGSMGELVSAGYMRRVPRDGWGHPLRLTCPGRRDPAGFDLASDGPDGNPGGTDRVE
jgi:general secretion pathway protein G